MIQVLTVYLPNKKIETYTTKNPKIRAISSADFKYGINYACVDYQDGSRKIISFIPYILQNIAEGGTPEENAQGESD